jgi:hypothetical protein
MVVFGRMLTVGCFESRSELDETQRQDELAVTPGEE